MDATIALPSTMIASPMAVLATLTGLITILFAIDKKYSPKFFQFLPPLIWIYLLPLLMAQFGIIPQASDAYTAIKKYGMPLFLTAMLMEIDIKAAFGVMRPAAGVMLCGSAGIVVGMCTGYAVVHQWLSPEAWKGYGTLAGSWIGGLGNMVAVGEALQTPSAEFGLAVVADNFGYILWLPLLLASKRISKAFARFSGSPADSIERMVESQKRLHNKSKEIGMFDLLALLFFGFIAATVGDLLAPGLAKLPYIGAILGESAWRVLLITSIAIPLSFTRAREIRGNLALGQAIIYLFVAIMGATASLEGLAQAPMFVTGALICLLIHGLFMVMGAKVFKTDVHTTAIASMANIGAAASAPVVAAYHNEKLVPMSILLALIGYAVGNYCALTAAYIMRWIGS